MVTRTTPVAGFRRVEELRAAVDRIPRTIAPWKGEEGPRWRITLSPGSVQIGSRDYGRIDRAGEQRIARELRDNPAMSLQLEPQPTRGQIRGWSHKSVINMARMLAAIDYSPILGDDTRPAMLTLTVPGDWEAVAGTPDQFKAAVNRFRERYRKAWGGSLAGVWKLEFQRRGAPHLHILMSVPDGTAPRPVPASYRAHLGGCRRDVCAHPAHERPEVDFREWAATSWALSVGASDVCDVSSCDHSGACSSEFSRNEAAGIRIDEDLTLRYGDAKRVAVYFSKHGSFEAKAYQNEPPQAWLDAIESGTSMGARFWGYWVVRPVREVVETDESLIIIIARIFRRIEASRSHSRPTTVYRVNQRTGVVKRRKVNRRVRYLKGSRGFITVNDGVATAETVERLVRYFMEAPDFFGPVPAMRPRSGLDGHASLYE